ncbi:hypothetical protein AAGS61_01640 [Lysinibacillus sp. KU-BSD001]|uniref:hypothetical protein n=1 Tax=Lysinibacillus sp. KU-BSD001 TaxID=3141328 RepID=UPI0036E6ACC3
MLNRAIEKLENEMTASNKYVQVVGQFLLEYIQAQPDAAVKILAEDKTVKGSLQHMKNAARKQAVDGMAMLTEEEGFAIVLKYFDIEGPPVLKQAPVPKVEVQSAAPAAPKKAKTASKKKKPSEKVVHFPGTEFVQTTLDDFFSEGEF